MVTSPNCHDGPTVGMIRVDNINTQKLAENMKTRKFNDYMPNFNFVTKMMRQEGIYL